MSSHASKTSPSGFLEEGRRLHAQGRVQEAFSRYREALAVAPDDPDALHLTGVAYLNLGQSQLGIAYIRQAVTRRPAAVDYRVNLAGALVQAMQFDEAAEHLERACALDPSDAGAFGALGALRLRQGRFDAAERSYEAAAALEPRRASWHEALAHLRYRRWAIPAAIESADLAAAATKGGTARRPNLGVVRPSQALQARPALPEMPCASELGQEDVRRACVARELLVIDDFLDDPLAFRAEALALCKDASPHGPDASFPGLQTAATRCEATMQRLADSLQRPLKWDSPDNGALRLSLAGDTANADVHVDSAERAEIFGGVLYLTSPEDCRGGTSFYRHRASGWDRRPDSAQCRERGHASFREFQKRELPPNRRRLFAEWRRDRAQVWEWLFEVPMRFNRLVVFRSDYFHAISDLFGDRAENGRLVQLFHFEAGPVTSAT